ncbi:LysM peptidoglycan-binding domain-containing protein [Crassaminicella profunda]|uniref:LysM peptidoglycan-binding domain-containing protein n=1 Tax=Crassaminicella profunda TaxID=1286698 RepID=UPI001CA6D1A7|nr:LysM peptidoglycan-binding domain-containing protein [Crassaminicella profunda]QZY56978.1 LysM peptidoglycan-binding domain-containing protein [Crassaminicella profunda]
MTITKFRKIPILFLITGILGYGYFHFIINPQISKFKDLKENIKKYQSEIQKNKIIVASKDKVDKEFENINKDIIPIKKSFFSSLEQEQIIILLNEILDHTMLQVSSIDFSEFRKEQIKEYTLDAITVKLPFEGNYDALLNFMKKIREYKKKIIVKGLRIENNESGQLIGNIFLDFYSLPNDKDDTYLTEYFNKDELGKENPFAPFDGFVENPFDELTDNNQQISSTETLPKRVLLNGFEKATTFFVGSPKKVIGKITRDTNSVQGKYSTRLEYDFLRGRLHSIGNVVYEGKKVLITKQAENIGLWVYAFEKSHHSIGIILKDTKGKIYKIPLANEIDWLKWKSIEAVLPIEIAYPAEVQRIYVESVEFDNKTKGVLLFDKLEITYPNVLPYKTNKQIAKNTTPNENKEIPQNTNALSYTVLAGDTIFSIADKFYHDYTKRHFITEYNNLKDSSSIYVGQVLYIPNATTTANNQVAQEDKKENISQNSEASPYEIQPKDTIFSISKKFYNDYSKRHLIMEYNQIQDPNDIKIGQIIYIPKLQ